MTNRYPLVRSRLKTLNAVLGHLIRQARAEKGATQEDVARILGVSRATVSFMEAGTQWMRAAQLIELCTVLEIDIKTLYEMAVGITEGVMK